MASVADRLRQFGFTEKEADTYLAILELGEASVVDIADETGISKKYTYDILDTLADRSFIRLNDHQTPTTARAVPPADAMERLETELSGLTTDLEERFSASKPSMPEMEVVQSRQTAYRRLRTVVEAATEHVLLAIPYQALDNVADALADARERGVFVMALVTGAPTADVDMEQVTRTTTVARAWDADIEMLVAADNDAALIGDPQLLYGKHAEADYGLLVEFSPKMNGAVDSLLGNFWTASEEIHVAEPAALPATFDCFRYAVLTAEQYRRRETTLHVTVERVGGNGTVSGRLVDIRQNLLDPPKSDFPLENNLWLERDEGVVSVGGPGAFLEDYEAETITLEPAPE